MLLNTLHDYFRESTIVLGNHRETLDDRPRIHSQVSKTRHVITTKSVGFKDTRNRSVLIAHRKLETYLSPCRHIWCTAIMIKRLWMTGLKSTVEFARCVVESRITTRSVGVEVNRLRHWKKGRVIRVGQLGARMSRHHGVCVVETHSSRTYILPDASAQECTTMYAGC